MSKSDIVKCPFCYRESEHGVKVCVSCNSDVVYGATNKELADAKNTGMLLFGGLSAFLIFLLPIFLKIEYYQPGLGIGEYAIIIVIGAAIYGSFMMHSKAFHSGIGKVTFIRK